MNVCLEKPSRIKCCKRVQVSNLKWRSTRRNKKGKETILSQFYSSVRLNFKWWRLWRRYDKSFALDGYTVHLALSIFCSLKLASSALLYVLLQLTQNLPSLYKDRNVLVDWQRGQFVNLGFNSDFFCNLSHVSNIVNPLMVFIFIFPYRYNL